MGQIDFKIKLIKHKEKEKKKEKKEKKEKERKRKKKKKMDIINIGEYLLKITQDIKEVDERLNKIENNQKEFMTNLLIRLESITSKLESLIEKKITCVDGILIEELN